MKNTKSNKKLNENNNQDEIENLDSDIIDLNDLDIIDDEEDLENLLEEDSINEISIEEDVDDDFDINELLDDSDDLEISDDELEISIDDELDNDIDELLIDESDLEKEKDNVDSDIDELLGDSDEDFDVEDTIVDLLTEEDSSSKNVNEASILEDENENEINSEVENNDLEDFFNEVEDNIEAESNVEIKDDDDDDDDDDANFNIEDAIDEESDFENDDFESEEDLDFDDMFDEKEDSIDTAINNVTNEEEENLFDDNEEDDFDDLFNEENEELEVVDEDDFITDQNKEDKEDVNLLDTEDLITDELDNESVDNDIDLFGSEVENSSTNKKDVEKENIEPNELELVKKENNKEKKMSENNIKNNSNKGLLITLSAVSFISLTGLLGTGFLLKDDLSNSINSLLGKTNSEAVQLINKEEFNAKNNEIISMLESMEVKLTETQKENLEPVLNSIRSNDAEIRMALNKISQQNQSIEELKSLTEAQRQHLVKSIKLTLSVIENSKGGSSESNAALYDSLYDKLSQDLKSINKTQIEEIKRLNEETLKEVRTELKQIKTENIKLRGKVSKVEEKIIEDINDKTVVQLLDNEKSKKSSNIEITKVKNVVNDEPRKYNIVGIVDGIAYILPDGASSNKDLIMYQVNDHIPDYGKILRITGNQIIAEKGIVRKK